MIEWEFDDSVTQWYGHGSRDEYTISVDEHGIFSAKGELFETDATSLAYAKDACLAYDRGSNKNARES